jgi:glycosyltransferase involved in cell wall biosynthesis
VIVTDESFRDFIAQQRFPDREKVVFAAEPSGFSDGRRRTDARRRLGVKDEQVVLLVYGSIEARKGVLTLCQAVADRACPRELMVLLAGTKTDDVLNVRHESALQALRDRGRLIEISGFFTGEEELEIFSAADIVWLGYEGFYGMSGVLVQAGSMGLPVIACEEGLIGWVSKKYRMGITVRAREVASVVGALSRLASDPALRHELGENGRAMAAGHDPRSFGRCVCDVLERLGQADAPAHG